MKYKKPAISLEEQIATLKARGLSFGNDTHAKNYLSNISYYRLRAYTYPFQDNDDPNHPFVKKVSFEQIIELYVFDRKLRLLVLDGLEKIEIAMRTQIIHQWSMTNGSHWQHKPNLYRDSVKFARQISSLEKEVDRSHETFIKHYRKKYSDPAEPPSWMGLEITSIGLLSMLFQNLRNGPEKKAVTAHFGLKKVDIIENWFHSFSNIRNICAHHGRLWNRRLTNHIKLPTHTEKPFITERNIYNYKLYSALCCMEYVLRIISPKSTFKERLFEHLETCPFPQEKEMGFPDKWRDDSFWK